MLTLYHAPLSPCAQKVRLVLHEKKLPYESVLIDLMRKENLKADYLKINPNGVVPTLVEDGRVVMESSVICEYLDDRYPDEPLRPKDAGELATLRLLAKRVDDKIHPSSGVLLFGAIVRRSFLSQTKEERAAMLAQIPDPARRERQADLLENGLESSRLAGAVKILKDMANDIEAIVSRSPWMLGERLSLADFSVTPYVRMLEMLGLAKVFSARPALTDWLARVKRTAGYIGGIQAFETPEDAAKRAPLLASITAKLEPMF